MVLVKRLSVSVRSCDLMVGAVHEETALVVHMQ